MKIKFPGGFEMKKLVRISFIYEDGTSDEIIDPRAAILFQSRCNSAGVIAGMEEFVVPVEVKN